MSPINYLLAARDLATPSPSAVPAATSATPSSDDLRNLPQWVGPVAWVFFALALLLLLYTGGKSLRRSLTAERTLEEKILNPSPKERTSNSSETTLVGTQPKPRVSRLAPPPPAYIVRASQSMSKDEGALFRLTGENTWHNKLASQRAMAEGGPPLPPILRPEGEVDLIMGLRTLEEEQPHKWRAKVWRRGANLGKRPPLGKGGNPASIGEITVKGETREVSESKRSGTLMYAIQSLEIKFIPRLARAMCEVLRVRRAPRPRAFTKEHETPSKMTAARRSRQRWREESSKCLHKRAMRMKLCEKDMARPPGRSPVDGKLGRRGKACQGPVVLRNDSRPTALMKRGANCVGGARRRRYKGLMKGDAVKSLSDASASSAAQHRTRYHPPGRPPPSASTVTPRSPSSSHTFTSPAGLSRTRTMGRGERSDECALTIRGGRPHMLALGERRVTHSRRGAVFDGYGGGRRTNGGQTRKRAGPAETGKMHPAAARRGDEFQKVGDGRRTSAVIGFALARSHAAPIQNACAPRRPRTSAPRRTAAVHVNRSRARKLVLALSPPTASSARQPSSSEIQVARRHEMKMGEVASGSGAMGLRGEEGWESARRRFPADVAPLISLFPPCATVRDIVLRRWPDHARQPIREEVRVAGGSAIKAVAFDSGATGDGRTGEARFVEMYAVPLRRGLRAGRRRSTGAAAGITSRGGGKVGGRGDRRDCRRGARGDMREAMGDWWAAIRTSVTDKAAALWWLGGLAGDGSSLIHAGDVRESYDHRRLWAWARQSARCDLESEGGAGGFRSGIARVAGGPKSSANAADATSRPSPVADHVARLFEASEEQWKAAAERKARESEPDANAMSSYQTHRFAGEIDRVSPGPNRLGLLRENVERGPKRRRKSQDSQRCALLQSFN
ncbi:hypothetical protein C8R47DRAFT_1192456 [Mycena vitilis]|nr:hypothetical protein C8R47DRAFT_1192456 [Mycena vitilis]